MSFILQEPNQELTVTLPFQKAVPEADRIQWKVRALSSRAHQEYEREFRRVLGLEVIAETATAKSESAEPPPEDLHSALNAMIRRVVVGWSNIIDAAGQPMPFNDDSLNIFSAALKMQIVHELPDAAGWGDVQAKKSPSP